MGLGGARGVEVGLQLVQSAYSLLGRVSVLPWEATAQMREELISLHLYLNSLDIGATFGTKLYSRNLLKTEYHVRF